MGKNDLRIDTRYMEGSVSRKEIEAMFPMLDKAHESLEKKDGKGSEFLGWLDLPGKMLGGPARDIADTARELKDMSDTLVVIGIGGSYLGSRAAIEALRPGVVGKNVLFAGNDISAFHITSLLEGLADREVCVNVISKSGTTTEPALAFRMIKAFMKDKYGADGIRQRIVCTTDREKGALRSMADSEGYRSFVIPGDVGGRFSVLTPVGLLPMAYAGIDIKDVLAGAEEQKGISSVKDVDANPSYMYAAIRNVLYGKGKKVEILSNFDPRLHYLSEWWKQLFGESEGKEGRGVFPASCDFTTDLHSMGQLIQEGERNIFETFIIPEDSGGKCVVPRDDKDEDGLNYLAGQDLRDIDLQAYKATAEAHFEGGVPNCTVFFGKLDGHNVGRLFYFFEKAVAVSGYISGVNPFDQPGVESYKTKMYRLLGKPGY